MTRNLRNWGVVVVAMLGALTCSSCLSREEGAMRGEDGKGNRIGVYDSRSIAIAYAGSAAHGNSLKGMMEEHTRAKEAGDAEEVERLEELGRELQKRMHQQALGTASVEDILTTIDGKMEEMKESQGLKMIISIWDAQGLAKHAGAEQVDVTMELVDLLDPNELQRRRALEIREKKPVEQVGGS